jgi:hypothetical protein
MNNFKVIDADGHIIERTERIAALSEGSVQQTRRAAKSLYQI